MKIWEILKEENVGKKYKDNLKNKIWEIKKYKTFINLVDEFNTDITRTYDSWDLITLDFEEVGYWLKVDVDTKILVTDSKDHDNPNVRCKKYFAKFDNGMVYTWDNELTSFTVNSDNLCMGCKYAKLYKEEK